MKESGKQMFLIDGFPRNKDNLEGWNRQMGSKADVKGVLFFECDNDVNQNFFLLIFFSNYFYFHESSFKYSFIIF